MSMIRKRYDDLLKHDMEPKLHTVVGDNKITMQDADSKKDSASPSSIGMEDKLGMIVLLLLYTLQGIPMGLCGSIPLIMKERGVSYEGLSLFSLVSIPFSLKLLWAPLVDSCYFRNVGRRKTWIIPVQILTGIVMLVAAPHVGSWMGNIDSNSNGGEIKGPQVAVLTVFFLFLYFLMATQDIVVDGWALTMLSRENVGYASVCNSIGQSFGYFLANQGFIALSDAKWCHRHLGTAVGATLVTLSGFMHFFGLFFIISTVVLTIFKKEKLDESGEVPEGLLETYQHIVAIFRLKSVQQLSLLLLTCRIAFAPADAVSNFKLQEYGMPKADIATISPILLVIGLVLPALTSESVSKRPLDVFMIGIPLKLVTSVLGWYVVQTTHGAYQDGKEPGILFFGPLVAILVFNEIAGSLIFSSVMSFFARVSDPAIGGTYMTLLNTVTNLGSKWPNATALYLLPKLTYATCGMTSTSSPELGDMLSQYDCSHSSTLCVNKGGQCNILLDGYTIESVVCVIVGVLWIYTFRDTVARLQSLPYKEWLVIGRDKKNSTETESLKREE